MKTANSRIVKTTDLVNQLKTLTLTYSMMGGMDDEAIKKIASQLDPEMADLNFIKRISNELKVQGKLD